MSLKNLSVKTKIPKILLEKLKNKKVNRIYKKFEKSLNVNLNFAVAVSGGADSLALCFFSKIYSIKRGLKCKFYIVDHKLRPESTKEALNVKKVLKKLSIKADILTWKRKKSFSNIQSAARKKRFQLLFVKSDKSNINDILLGHHQDDLIENFFIRISRGSGLKGLISLSKKSKILNKNIYRPLLDQKKEDLQFVADYVFNFYVSDPSNEDEKFKRIRVRKMISQVKKEGFDKKKMMMTIQNLKYSNDAINFYYNSNLNKNTFFSEKKKIYVLNDQFFHQPHEIIFRGLSDIIKIVGKKFNFVRGKKLDYVIHKIRKDKLYRGTLGGCKIKRVNQTVIISKEH